MNNSTKRFVLSEWFKSLTLGRADPEKTLASWNDEKAIYDTYMSFKTRPMFTKEMAAGTGKFFRDLVGQTNVIFWDYLNYLHDEKLISNDEWTVIQDKETNLREYGWYKVADAKTRSQYFKPVKTNRGYYVRLTEPRYISHRAIDNADDWFE